MKDHLLSASRSRMARVLQWLSTWTVITIAIAGCATQLAPQYDETLVTGINDVNKQIMELYASTSMGVARETFPNRVDQYNKIIGKLDALALQSANRPVPETKVQKRVSDAVKRMPPYEGPMGADLQGQISRMASACATQRKVKPFPINFRELPSEGYVPASANALNQMSKGITFLRETDCAVGLNAGTVTLNRNFVTTFMDQALTYETYLKD